MHLPCVHVNHIKTFINDIFMSNVLFQTIWLKHIFQLKSYQSKPLVILDILKQVTTPSDYQRPPQRSFPTITPITKSLKKTKNQVSIFMHGNPLQCRSITPSSRLTRKLAVQFPLPPPLSIFWMSRQGECSLGGTTQRIGPGYTENDKERHGSLSLHDLCVL